MGSKITFYMLSDSGAKVKQKTVSKAFIRCFVVAIITCLLSMGLVSYYCIDISGELKEKQQLEQLIADHRDEIAAQRQQIQKFADDINALKSKLIALNNFEHKIRIIANVEPSQDQASVLGIGGSLPEDLNAQIPLSSKHSGIVREMHEQVKQLAHASTKQKESFQDLFSSLENKLNLLACTPSIRPIKGDGSWVTSRFGYRKSPFTSRKEFHKGLDFACREGTPIVAPADGVVTFAKRKGLMGNMMIINHGHGMVTRYGHISKFSKKRGDKVKRGETIALVGNTGRSTGPHLHYEIKVDGVQVNPEKYILN